MKTLIFIGILLSTNLFADELKVKDLNNTTTSMENASPSSTPNLSPEQIAELQKQIKDLKDNQEKAMKALEEMDKE